MQRKKKVDNSGSEVDMTPMIDVVFQLIIFFIVTIKLEQEYNKKIELDDAKYGPPIEKEDPKTLNLEVDQYGRISIHNAKLSREKLRALMIRRYNQYGSFPILIRADRRTPHQDVRGIMDVCTQVGMWRISFAAIKEKKT